MPRVCSTSVPCWCTLVNKLKASGVELAVAGSKSAPRQTLRHHRHIKSEGRVEEATLMPTSLLEVHQ